MKSSTQRGYDVHHRRFRQEQLAWRVVCECCDSRPSTEIHHLVPIDGDRFHPLRMVQSNVLAVCKRCHVWITLSIEPSMPRPELDKFVLFGRPGSGKTTKAAEIAENYGNMAIWDWDVERPKYASYDICTRARIIWADSTRPPCLQICTRAQLAYEIARRMSARLIYCPCHENERQERLSARL